MKKFGITLLVLISIANICLAKNTKTPNEKVLSECSTLIKNYENSKIADDGIIAFECIQKASKKYKLNTNLLCSENLYYLYSEKYSKSAENPKYLDKAYKYAFTALNQGTNDKQIIEDAVYLAIIKKNLKALNYSYERLSLINPDKASELYEQVIYAKDLINKEKEIKINNFADSLNTFMESAFCTNDPLTGKCIGETERKNRDEALLKQGTSYEQLLLQKQQSEELNRSLQDINSSLQRLTW